MGGRERVGGGGDMREGSDLGGGVVEGNVRQEGFVHQGGCVRKEGDEVELRWVRVRTDKNKSKSSLFIYL